MFWYLERVRSYWAAHSEVPDHGLMYPTHKTPDDKRLKANKLARQRRAAAKDVT